MKPEELTKLLSDEDFHLDPLGRIVINNKEILDAINGAMGSAYFDEMLCNGGCANGAC